eukprot:3716201-Rhodomonas_salina.2
MPPVRCAVLTYAMLLPGCAMHSTDTLHCGYTAVLTHRLYCSTDTGYAATRIDSDSFMNTTVRDPISLCFRYAMPGTDIDYGAMCLWFRYAMSGAETDYGAMGLGVR